MHRFALVLRWLTLLPLIALLSACMEVDVRFEVRPDGSGRVIETYRVNGDASWLPSGTDPLSAYLNASGLTERAAAMGAGVSVKTQTLPQPGEHRVARITYEVPDFNGLVWRFGPRPTADSLSYRFELNRRAGQPLRVNVLNDPFVASLHHFHPQDAQARRRLVETIEDMSGVAVNVTLVGTGELLKSTATWQSGETATLLEVRADDFTAQAGWQQRISQGDRPGWPPCASAEVPTMRMDCQAHISLWLR